MAEYKYIVIHFGEIFLKGRNRGTFIKRLYDNTELVLKGEKYAKLENARDRFILHLSKSSNIDRIMKKLGHVFGISWFAPVLITGNSVSEILKASKGLFKKDELVRVDAHRSWKELKYTSIDLVGQFLKNQKKLGYILDKNAEKELYINVRKDDALIYKGKTRGLGGLPVGSSGKAIVLLSGGIDSPVASFYAMKKGLTPIYLHMHAYPDNKTAEKSKMKKIIDELLMYSPESKTYFVPSHQFTASILGVKPKYELILFKRFLYRMAEKIAEKEHAEVIATGESLGQVASQTVRNLIASEKGSKLFAMRPLIGFDKQEIIEMAKKIVTYELSIQKYPDVCSLRARNPATGARSEIVDSLYDKHKLKKALDASLKKADIV